MNVVFIAAKSREKEDFQLDSVSPLLTTHTLFL